MDRAVVERAQHGDEAAFETLAAASVPRLWSIARRIVGDHDAAEDAVQDCLVRAWRDLRGLRDPDRFEAWLYRLLLNACRDRLRSLRREATTTLAGIPEPATAIDPTAAVETSDQLQRGFERLSVEHRAVLVLHHVLGLRAREIAVIVGAPAGTVESRIHYATHALRSALEADLRVAPAVANAAAPAVATAPAPAPAGALGEDR